MVQEGVNQGPGRMARSRMDYDTRLFIQDDDGIVLKEDLQRKGLRL
jgi:hypothetical protein